MEPVTVGPTSGIDNGIAATLQLAQVRLARMSESTLREHGLRIGNLEAGAANAITDVGGVRVGHVTVVRDEPEPPVGRGLARTGVTAILPGPGDPCTGGLCRPQRRR